MGMDIGAVGFVGLGNIGQAMATRLADWPGGLWVYDLAPEPLAELEQVGARIAGSVAELAGHVDLICVMVRDEAQVRDVLDEALRGATMPLTVAIHSTVAPHTPAALAKRAASHNVEVVDAPVSGGQMGAAEGTLAIMVGGSDAAYTACGAPLSRMGSRLVHAGAIGAGTQMKLARNLVHFVSFTAATEAQRLAEAAGLNLVDLGKVVRHTDTVTGGPGAIMHRETTAPLAPEDFWFGAFDHARALGTKDLRFALELADELDIDAPLAKQALISLGPGLGLGHAAEQTEETEERQE